MNPMQLIQMIRNGQNPQAQLTQLLQQQNSPVAQNLLTMINNNDKAGIESLVRNLVESQGKDFNKEFASFKQMLGLK